VCDDPTNVLPAAGEVMEGAALATPPANKLDTTSHNRANNNERADSLIVSPSHLTPTIDLSYFTD